MRLITVNVFDVHHLVDFPAECLTTCLLQMYPIVESLQGV